MPSSCNIRLHTAKEVRNAHHKAGETLAKDTDPGEAKRIERVTRHLASSDRFEAVAIAWFGFKLPEKPGSSPDPNGRCLSGNGERGQPGSPGSGGECDHHEVWETVYCESHGRYLLKLVLWAVAGKTSGIELKWPDGVDWL
jgi:hypothetical protein